MSLLSRPTWRPAAPRPALTPRWRWRPAGRGPETGRSGPGTPDGIRLVAGWSFIAVADAMELGRYSIAAVTLVTVGTVVVVGSALTRRRALPWTRLSGVMAVPAVLTGLTYAMGGATSGPVSVAHLLLVLAAALVTAGLVFDLPRSRWLAGIVIVVFTAAGIEMIRGLPAPDIDVWYMLQSAAHALSHGHNIYATRWTSGVPGEMSNGFAYLPGSALLLWPFQLLFGDVRYGLLAALVVTAVILWRVSPRKTSAALLGPLVLLYPHAIVGLGQAWIDPLALSLLCGTAYAVIRGRHGWATVCFGLCLLCKQQLWILLPLAFFWKDFGWRRAARSAVGALAGIVPWVITDPRAFYDSGIGYNLFLAPRADSLSLVRTIESFGVFPGVGFTALATLGAIVVVVRRFPPDTFGFLLGSAVVMAVFNLANKQTHYNEWELAAGILLAAIVFGQPGRDRPASATHDGPTDSAALGPPLATTARR